MEQRLSGWERVKESQEDAVAVIRELHAEMDKDVRHERRSGFTRVDVVSPGSSSDWSPPRDFDRGE